MNIQPISQQNFKGYDARPLKGFMMSSNCRGIADEMSAIGKREGFKIFAAFNPKMGGAGEFLPPYSKTTENLWAQDVWMMVKNKLMALECDIRSNSIKDFFKLKYDFTEQVARNTDEFKSINTRLWELLGCVDESPEIMKEYQEKQVQLRQIQDKAHIPGGNIFLVKNGNKNDVLVGDYELQIYSPDEIGGMYCTDKVIPLPQMDYHTDLFIRPLDKKRILLADDDLTYKILKDNSSPIAEAFKDVVRKNRLPQANDVAEVLKRNGYKVIRVPGRIYSPGVMEDGKTYLRHHCNYMNANVLKNPNGDLVYITNKSNVNKLAGFDFEKAFIDTLAPFIKKEKVYFIEGEDNFVANEMLKDYQGGIHCTCMEVL